MVPSTGGRAAASLPCQEPPHTGQPQALTAPGCVLSSAMILPTWKPQGKQQGQWGARAGVSQGLHESETSETGWDCTPFPPSLPSLSILTMKCFWLPPAMALQLFIPVKASGEITNNQPSTPKLHSTDLSPPYPTMVLPPSPGSSFQQESDLVPQTLHQTGDCSELTAPWHSLSFSG